MKLTENKIYFIYIFLGLLYLISKVIYYICGFVYPCGVILGLIAAILTTCIGIFALKEYKVTAKPIAHWLAALIPLVILPLTPIIMMNRLGDEMFHLEKISILIIFEALAIAQIVLAVWMLRGLKFRRKRMNG